MLFYRISVSKKIIRKHLGVSLKICAKGVLVFVFLLSLKTNVNIFILPQEMLIYIGKNDNVFQKIHASISMNSYSDFVRYILKSSFYVPTCRLINKNLIE